MLYRVAHGNLETSTMFTEIEADRLIERVQPFFSKPLQKIPVEVEEKPRLWVVEGGRK
jgi:hypothetical protein